MKAIVNGNEIEGTADEIMRMIQLYTASGSQKQALPVEETPVVAPEKPKKQKRKYVRKKPYVPRKPAANAPITPVNEPTPEPTPKIPEKVSEPVVEEPTMLTPEPERARGSWTDSEHQQLMVMMNEMLPVSFISKRLKKNEKVVTDKIDAMTWVLRAFSKQ